jgi:hypothetical protein
VRSALPRQAVTNRVAAVKVIRLLIVLNGFGELKPTRPTTLIAASIGSLDDVVLQSQKGVVANTAASRSMQQA